MYDPKNNGFCVYECAKFLGYDIVKKPWMTLGQVRKLEIPFISVRKGRIV